MKILPKSALITGASSGLGAAFARALSAAGCRCTLVARNTERLESLAGEIAGAEGSAGAEGTAGAEGSAGAGADGRAPVVFTADLAEPEGLGSAARLITEKRPELLVLNAGFGLPEPFAECDPQKLSQMVRVHVDHVVQLLRAYLKPPAGELSMVIVVASVAAFTPAPLAVLYTATKRFQVELVRALAIGHPGTYFQVLCPGLISTDFHRRMGHTRDDRPGMLPWYDAADVARHSLRKLGSRKLIVVPGLAYRLLLIFRSAIPDPLYRAFMRRFSRLTPLGEGI